MVKASRLSVSELEGRAARVAEALAALRDSVRSSGLFIRRRRELRHCLAVLRAELWARRREAVRADLERGLTDYFGRASEVEL